MTCVMGLHPCCSRTASLSPNVKEQMGHSSINMTVAIYGLLVPAGNRQAVDKLGDVPPAETRKTETKWKQLEVGSDYRGVSC
jgi:hypothetical protein